MIYTMRLTNTHESQKNHRRLPDPTKNANTKPMNHNNLLLWDNVRVVATIANIDNT